MAYTGPPTTTPLQAFWGMPRRIRFFFRTVDDECLYVQPLCTFGARSRAVDRFVWYYNHERPHQSLHGMTPVARRTLYFKQAG